MPSRRQGGASSSSTTTPSTAAVENRISIEERRDAADPKRDAVIAVLADNNNSSNGELPECKVRRNYTCTSCNDFFTQNPRLYLYHLRDVHRIKLRVYECPSCLYASKHFQKLLRHSKMVHGTSEGVTPAETSAPRKPEEDPCTYEDHDEMLLVEEQEEQSVFKCSVCTFSSRSRVLLNRHEREEHIKTKFFRCSKCTYVTHIKARYTKHVKYHSMPMIKCDMCDFRTPYKWNLDRHCKNHNGRGAFRCSACNFTADIKQSLTVHEMNHHVPPVGQAAGLGVGRRRNKVGASDSTAAEEEVGEEEEEEEEGEEVLVPVSGEREHDGSVKVGRGEKPPSDEDRGPLKEDTAVFVKSKPKIKITPRKTKATPLTSGSASKQSSSDFIHPDDIVQHSNGRVYIKTKCKLCNFKTPWDTEMAKHEKLFHNLNRDVLTNKKPSRPIPNLIPIKQQPSSSSPSKESSPIMSDKDISDICSRSANSALKDFASLFGSEDVFKTPTTSKVPDLIPTSFFNKPTINFKEKNASFFDRLKERLELGSASNLTCKLCGYESKCLTEQAKHQKRCGKKETDKVPKIIPVHNISASRCQYCRQRCKSSADLYVHLQGCAQALRAHSEFMDSRRKCTNLDEDDTSSEHENELKIDEDRNSTEEEPTETKPHPMENKVFVWNDILVPMDIDVDDSNYEYQEDKIEDNGSLDLSIRTQSPVTSENSFIQENNNTLSTTNNNIPTTPVRQSPISVPTEKIPTHGNDISVAQHKRVFKCPHCTFWASTASRFHVHIVGHLNKKPFECSLCSYRSNWRWDITKHIKLKSVRDQAHENAKVLMTDETGRRNYTKYNKYLTEIPLSSLQNNETSGGSGTRPRNHDRNSSPSTSKEKQQKAPTSGDFNSLLKLSSSNIRASPALKVAEKQLMANVTQEKKRSSSDGKRTLFKCKKCNFRDASRDILLQHVRGHYEQQPSPTDLLLDQQHQEQLFQQAVAAAQAHQAAALGTAASPLALVTSTGSGGASSALASLFATHQDLSLRGTSSPHDDHDRDDDDDDEASVNNQNGSSTATTAASRGGGGSSGSTNANVPPFRCGHCNQVSNWKHVIQRHCRLKHSGDIRVVSTKNGQEKIEIEEQLLDDLDDLDPSSQSGVYKCSVCPYTTDTNADFQGHFEGHLPQNTAAFKCMYCNYRVNAEKDFIEHLKLHETTSSDPEGKKFKCSLCPYVTNSKSQYTYHKQFHKYRGGQYVCDHCNYNVSKRHLLHQHMKVHGINMKNNSQAAGGDSGEEVSDSTDIPLVWVSKNNQFSKMFKCRFCPHVNSRKVNIQEHEKMHGAREKSPKVNEQEHKCTECNYVCNNAGVLSSHIKVHQGVYGVVHCPVDTTKPDEEQLKELLGNNEFDTSEFLEVEMEEVDTEKFLHFCQECPARFLKENELAIHKDFHNNLDNQFKCEHCTYATNVDDYLKSHSKVHTTDYQERTNVLKSFHTVSSEHAEAPLKEATGPEGDVIWKTEPVKSKLEQKNNILASFLSKPLKSALTVPLSGTDLFQQLHEAQQRQSATEETQTKRSKASEEHFGTQMHGNPDFIYQTYIKNGRAKEKRYKCHKCPSAFEKREQYKIHLGLHGSNQRYNCAACDYSVKYYANFVQHLKKHKFSDDAHAAKKEEDSEENLDDDEDEEEEAEEDSCTDLVKISAEEQQMSEILHQRTPVPSEEKKLHWCQYCPYVNTRRDALENHQKKHKSVSGVVHTYACDHCDFSVPQVHFLRDHTKLHFIPNKVNHVNGYMLCDNLRLEASNGERDNEVLLDNDDEGEKFNNNKGEVATNSVENTNNLQMEVN
ncbi:uncharacterized protein LOC126743997 isoform X2 [Anthonomus grandis grandis]|nr:uncharacterized protein LOC126743997 isoform X2 [Anthonomus grandis grandis]XP_050307258.1 uncharacterized protein LOC126743997 isoform X2 [Anthonomus grandis grandis]